MSYLEQVSKPAMQPPMITIVGSPGVGKTSLAGTFPNAIFVQTENAGTVFENWSEEVQPDLMPIIAKARKDEQGNMVSSVKDTLMAQVRELATAEHSYTTLVIDSITALNIKLEHELALRDGVASVADAAGGFHKGFDVIANWHADFIYACDVLRKRKNMAIVFLAHEGVEKVKNSPDEASEYSVYSLDMHKKSTALYASSSDAVFYIKKEAFVNGSETNKKGQTTKYGRLLETGLRQLITTGDGRVGYVLAKNRYGMPAELDLPMGENPILNHIKYFNK